VPFAFTQQHQCTYENLDLGPISVSEPVGQPSSLIFMIVE